MLCRVFDLDFAELSHHEDVGLLAFSPLAAGILTGKYQGGVTPDGSRKSINGDLSGRWTERVEAVVDRYAGVAEKHGLNLVQMALAFCAQRPFMTSVIFRGDDDGVAVRGAGRGGGDAVGRRAGGYPRGV